MSVKYGLLGLLARKPQHGYELKRTFEQLTGGFWELNYGQIYQSLDKLSDDGYVDFTVEQEESVPDKKVYAITKTGREALKTWLANPEEPRPRPLRDELFIRLAVMSSEDASLLELLAQHQSVYLEKMQELTGVKRELQKRPRRGGDELVEELLVEVALLHAEADVKWLETCERKLRALARSKAN